MTSSISVHVIQREMTKLYDVFVAAIARSGLPMGPTCEVLEKQRDALVEEFVSSMRRRIDAISDLIVRRVLVNRNRTPQCMLDATSRNQYTDTGVVTTMPRGTGDEAEVIFFKVGLHITDADLDKEYALRNLVPADPFSLGAINEADPAFADEHPNGTHWKNHNGRWCYAAFHRWYGHKSVHVYREDGDWYGHWWFAGVRK